ncbi:hypothetical protein N7450_009100 [Penicillium hetheringtonii]|uniref:NmrA-like domain-containing protein n=1 Tax=Penicillium hetheringtonii TaxID=911720 RepID=A0AAD6DFS3_9EURO|nr:hypothetical protein N7450_009100 [Penicillium hetheringtonii]
MAAKNLLLFGATGQIGSFIVEAILNARSSFDRVAIFTSSKTAEAKSEYLENLKQQRVEILIGDVEDESAVKAAYKGIDTVISALGRNTLAQQISLIRLAAADPDVKWFFPSEYGTDIAYGPASANEKPHQQKLKVRAVLENEIPRKDLDYSYVVTGPFAEMYLHFTRAGRSRTGILVVAALLNAGPETRNRALRVNSFTTTPAEIQAEFERQTTGQPWETVSETSIDRLRELEKAAWDAGNPAATVLTLRRIWTEGGTLYEQRDNGVIGEPKVMSLQEVVTNEVRRVSSL